MTVIDQTEDLRHALADHLIAAGCITSPQVAAAFRAVPRHLFTPEVPREQAYRPYHHVRVKYDARGATISSVSAPYVQAIMLEQAHLTPGMRCLEIGSGGCNAALMAELVGPGGQVTTVDIDADIVARARRFLADAGYPHVHVVHADAAQGVPQRAPFDRIIVTAGVWDVPPAWREQLTDDGCIVLPLRMRGLSRSVALVRDGDRLVRASRTTWPASCRCKARTRTPNARCRCTATMSRCGCVRTTSSTWTARRSARRCSSLVSRAGPV